MSMSHMPLQFIVGPTMAIHWIVEGEVPGQLHWLDNVLIVMTCQGCLKGYGDRDGDSEIKPLLSWS